MDSLIKNLMESVRKGGSPWYAIMVATDFGKGDVESCRKYLQLLNESKKIKEKELSPLDEQPEGDSDSQGTDTFKGVTPFKAY